MKLNYKRLVGILVATLMVAFVVHRPLIWIFGHNIGYDCLTLFFTPFYLDAWLLHLDFYWPFDFETARKAVGTNDISNTLGCLSLVLGLGLSTIINTFIGIGCICFVKELFFDE